MKKFSLERQALHILDDMAKIPSSLGRLEKIATTIVKIQKTLNPEICKPTLLVACADHEIIEEGISASPSDVTYEQVRNFQNGGGACALLSEENNAIMNIYNIGIKREIPNSWQVNNNYFIKHSDDNTLIGKSLSKENTLRALDYGKEAVKEIASKGCNTIILGEMGVGNTTISSLLISSILNKPAENCVNRNHCFSNQIYENKIRLINKAKEIHEKDITNIFDTLSCYGGLEIAFLAGAILQGFKEDMCVLIDGFITSSALLIATEINSNCLDNCIACSKSAESTQDLIYNHLKISPVLDLNMSLGEGTGALVALPIIRNACFLFNSLKSCKQNDITNVHHHINIPFPLGTTSYILPDNIENNLKYLKTIKDIEDIELLFFESKHKYNYPNENTIKYLRKISTENKISYTVHLPYDVDIASNDLIARNKAINTWITFINLTKNLKVHGFVGHLHIADSKDMKSPFVIVNDIASKKDESIILAKKSIQTILKKTNIDSNMLCLETLEQPFNNIFQIVKEMNLGIALDIGHMVRFNTYNLDTISILLKYTRIIHLHGVCQNKDHKSLIENEDYDLDEFINILDNYNHKDIVVTIEVFNNKALIDSIKYLTFPKDK